MIYILIYSVIAFIVAAVIMMDGRGSERGAVWGTSWDAIRAGVVVGVLWLPTVMIGGGILIYGTIYEWMGK